MEKANFYGDNRSSLRLVPNLFATAWSWTVNCPKKKGVTHSFLNTNSPHTKVLFIDLVGP